MKIIAEIGLNHCGDESRCTKLVDVLLQSDVDGITFQIREADFYDGSHPRKNELSDRFYSEISSSIRSKGKEIGFAITRPEKVHVLTADFWKTLSWDLENIQFINLLKKTGKPIFASTGMSSLGEIVKVANNIDDLEFIHTQLDDTIAGVNLRAINTIADATQRPCGFGLHCNQFEVLYASLSFMPSNIFFYVKDETGMENPDDDWAIPLSQVDGISKNIRKLTAAVGDGVKAKKENILHPRDDNITQNK